MAETALQRAERQLAQAKARVQALRNREAAAERKLDTRRKVILGGALIDLATRDDAAASMLDRLVRNLARDQDRKAFEGWSVAKEGEGGNVDGDRGAEAGTGGAGETADGSGPSPTGGAGPSATRDPSP